MNFGVADRTVLVAWAAQIVKRRWSLAEIIQFRGRRIGSWGRDRRRRVVGVTFQADEADFVPRQHSRVGGTVGFVARVAAFEPHGGVLEHERSALVAMASDAGRLVPERCAHVLRPERSMGI